MLLPRTVLSQELVALRGQKEFEQDPQKKTLTLFRIIYVCKHHHCPQSVFEIETYSLIYIKQKTKNYK